MMFNVNMKIKYLSKKLKYNNGSTMTIVLVAMALLLIFVPYMTSQVTNQLKSTMKSSEDIKQKYLAEAGIEKSIYEIENQIKEKIAGQTTTVMSQSHDKNDSCPKVSLNDEGILVLGSSESDTDNTFYKLVYHQVINEKSNKRSDIILKQKWQNFFHKDLDLKTFYNSNIREVIQSITKLDKNQSKLLKLEFTKMNQNINEYITMLKEAKTLVSNSDKNNKEEDKEEAISGYDEMIEYMEEIKCRVSLMENSVIEESKTEVIEVPYYEVTIDDYDNVIFNKDDSKTIEYNITINKQNGSVISIDFTNINNNLIKANSYDYEISADVDFSYRVKSSYCFIDKSINSYSRIK